jgi:hypothetical protein
MKSIHSSDLDCERFALIRFYSSDLDCERLIMIRFFIRASRIHKAYTPCACAAENGVAGHRPENLFDWLHQVNGRADTLHARC